MSTMTSENDFFHISWRLVSFVFSLQGVCFAVSPKTFPPTTLFGNLYVSTDSNPTDIPQDPLQGADESLKRSR